MGHIDQEYAASIRLLRARLNRDVADRLDEGDFAENLLRLLRERPEARLLFSPDKLSAIARAAREVDPDEADWERDIADNAVEWRLYAASNAYCRRFPQIDRETFDFSTFDHKDPEALHGLNRLRWLRSLALAYWETGDRKYFDSLMEQWDFFVEKAPIPGPEFSRRVHAMGRQNMDPPWQELDTFIRLTNWYWAYWLALFAPEMTPERNAVLLSRCLRVFDIVASRGVRNLEHNKNTMGMEAIYFWASSLPEATGMELWRNMARNTLEASMSRGVFSDGAQHEKAAGYHAGCIRWYGTSFILGRRIGDEWATDYADRLRLMGEYLDAILTPDGMTPLMSDADRVRSGMSALALLRCAFPDITFRRPVAPKFFSAWVSDGMTWDPEDTVEERDPISVFEQAGVAVVRSGPGHEAPGVILDNGPTNAGHSHFDNLTIHYDLLEGPVIVDPGRSFYGAHAERAWVVNAESHNTVYIEDTPVEPGDWIREHAFSAVMGPEDERAGEILVGEQSGATTLQSYFRGHAEDPGAEVRRFVVMPNDPAETWLAVVDDIEGPEAHNWTTSWLFPASEPGRQTKTGYELDLDSGFCVRFAFVGDTLLALRDEAMFWCPQYAEKSPARWVRFTSHCERTRRAFLFVPLMDTDVTPDIELTSEGVVLSLDGRKREITISG